ncbi:MAG: LysR substrate-binding domain-containing protein, partial [Magnetospiraceae bacterium]
NAALENGGVELKINGDIGWSVFPWLGLEGPLAQSVVGEWYRQNVPESAISLRADSFVSLGTFAAGGQGLAVLPRHVGDAQPGLQRLAAPGTPLSVDLWVLCQQDILRSHRVRVCADFFFEALKARESQFTGL